jgi:coenzyme F420-0:L-glutamate ligase / coenzyme F420-1:gamma-L-glutamate ligase
MNSLTLTPLTGLPEIRPGDDLAALVLEALQRQDIRPQRGDVLVLCQKVVSKSEGRLVALDSVEPSPRALTMAAVCRKDPAVVELVLRESTEVVRCVPEVLVVRHRLGFVVANAGVDQSNVVDGDHHALLLPEDPNASALRLREDIDRRTDADVAVLINDSFGRAWREGVIGTCIGSSGFRALMDRRGQRDRHGRELKITRVAGADELSAAASMIMGQGEEGVPAVWVRGVHREWLGEGIDASHLVRAPHKDLFR